MEHEICTESCPLCAYQGALFFHQDSNKRSKRTYYQCAECHLVFVPSHFYLSAEQEKAEYDLHENALHDQGYQTFLSRFWHPFREQLPEHAYILEFGCGPGPVLAKMMQDEGHDVVLYDHFYFPDTHPLRLNYYDGISCTEVIEHLHQPKAVIESLLSYLTKAGVLGLMTKLVKGREEFANWHYKNDLTHVCFYSVETFNWLAAKYNLIVSRHGADVVLLKKEITYKSAF